MKESLILQELERHDSDDSKIDLTEARISFIHDKIDEFIAAIEEIAADDDDGGNKEFVQGLREGMRQGLEDFYGSSKNVALLNAPLTQQMDDLFDGVTVADVADNIEAVSETIEDTAEGSNKFQAMLKKLLAFKFLLAITAIWAVSHAIETVEKAVREIIEWVKKIWDKIPDWVKDGDGTSGALSDENVRAADEGMQGFNEQIFGEDGTLGFVNDLLPQAVRESRSEGVGRSRDEAHVAENMKRRQEKEQEITHAENSIAQVEKEIEQLSSAGLDTSALEERLAGHHTRLQGLLDAKDARANRPKAIDQLSEEDKIKSYQNLTELMYSAHENGDEKQADIFEDARNTVAATMAPETLRELQNPQRFVDGPGGEFASRPGEPDPGYDVMVEEGTYTGNDTTPIPYGALDGEDKDFLETVPTRDGMSDNLENSLTPKSASVTLNPTNVNVPVTNVTNNNSHIISPTPSPRNDNSSVMTFKNDQAIPNW